MNLPSPPGNPSPQGSSPNDSIEFACSGCTRRLRVPVAAAGRQAKCPYCGSFVPVPMQSETGLTAPMSPSVAGRSAPQPVSPSGNPNVQPGGISGMATEPLAPSSPQAPLASLPTPAAAQSQYAPQAATIGASGHVAPSGSGTDIQKFYQRIRTEISKIYVGQEELVLTTLVALFSGGHVLIESVPGLGKTLFVRTLGRVLGCEFGRVQFTADLMPSDITGAPIFDMKTSEFRFRPGPVFTQILLADEINRSPAKTHAALLEIMQEYRVTVDGTSHEIKRPFLVMATQNPIESEGTYNLPEAQLDRFMFKIFADYPAEQEEAQILKLHTEHADFDQRLTQEVQTITDQDEVLKITEQCNQIHIDERLIHYINTIVRLTRGWPQFHMGASPRAGIAIMQGAQTLAAFHGRDYAVPDDVVQLALPGLRHRVTLTAEAEIEGRRIDELLTLLIRSVEVPRI